MLAVRARLPAFAMALLELVRVRPCRATDPGQTEFEPRADGTEKRPEKSRTPGRARARNA